MPMTSPTHLRIQDLVARDHWVDAPLNHADPSGPSIRVYARELVRRGAAQDDKLPWAVFFQGGPGFESPRAFAHGGWLKSLLREHRVLLLDQRGTGRSTPVSAASLAHLTPREQADYLAHFRQDSIVRDAELFRAKVAGGRPWLAYGQSFGGWCNTTYLSFFPEALSGVLYTGGLPPVGWKIEDVYRATAPLVRAKTADFYRRFPESRLILRQICDRLQKDGPLRLPRGGVLSVRGLQYLGMHFYRGDGDLALHYMLERALEADGSLSVPFQLAFENFLSFHSNPLFAVLHEAIYADGPGTATDWAASRVRRETAAFDDFGAQELALTGEMIYPWMFEEFAGLAPWQPAAQLLAEKRDWPALYDIGQLAKNTVPCAAVVYENDMCVARAYTLDGGKRIRGLKTWITSEYEHDGSGVDGERVMDRLLGLMRGDLQR